MATRANPTSQNRYPSSPDNNDSNKLRNLVSFVDYIYKAVLTLTCILFILWIVTLPLMVKMFMDVQRALYMCGIKP